MTDSAALATIHYRGNSIAAKAPLRLGVPLPRGKLHASSELSACTATGELLPVQARPLARWPDGSLRWVLVDCLVDACGAGHIALVRSSRNVPPQIASIVQDDATLHLDTGELRLGISREGPEAGVVTVRYPGDPARSASSLRPVLTAVDGRRQHARFSAVEIEDAGPLRCCVVIAADFPGSGLPLELQLRITAWAGLQTVMIETRLRNPRAARHVGGLWDLGDAGSALFEDFSLRVECASPAASLRWSTAPGATREIDALQDCSLYQDSSGGEHWDSPNHVGAGGHSTVSFRGYQLRRGARDILESGSRAVPCLTVMHAGATTSVQPLQFWENFPMALRWREGGIEAGFFPTEARQPFELQGGEQKRHGALLAFGAGTDFIGPLHLVEASLAPLEVERSHAMRYIDASTPGMASDMDQYVSSLLAGPHSVAAKRELVDEYGWRSFGDLFADHEAVGHQGLAPFVSHYNNQYDFILGAGSQFLRSGDLRWWQLMDAAARHCCDIDVYHTIEDKPAFSGGLFWHSDHYKPARTATHRTYSAGNAAGPAYGGGPSNEHNYTSGLLLHYYLSGDPESAAGVRSLAEWVLAMDDGSRTLFGLFDEGPTGLASQTASSDWHRPGRGAGNSINALLDAFTLDGNRRHLEAAEELMRRCAHPLDDVAAMRLDEPELRWSYLVFLQVLARYLDLKSGQGEFDYGWHYGRACLLRYAAWMAEHEVPYKDVLHKVEIPTETWPAHDIRKAHVLYAAAEYADGQRDAWRERARFFAERSLADVLSFDTAFLTRPQVIFCVYGHVARHYAQRTAGGPTGPPAVRYDFGLPQPFVPQRIRWRGTLRNKLTAASRELRRAVADAVSARLRRFRARK